MESALCIVYGISNKIDKPRFSKVYRIQKVPAVNCSFVIDRNVQRYQTFNMFYLNETLRVAKSFQVNYVQKEIYLKIY